MKKSKDDLTGCITTTPSFLSISAFLSICSNWLRKFKVVIFFLKSSSVMSLTFPFELVKQLL